MTDAELTAQNSNVVYQELCNSYRAIDSFRGQLLGLLPIASGAGIFLLLNDAMIDSSKLMNAKEFLEPIGYFGIAITLSFYCFELYGIKKCHCLIALGKTIETDLLKINGQFTTRPRGILFDIINEPFAAAIIYPAVLAAWMCLILFGNVSENECLTWAGYWPAMFVFFTGFILTLCYSTYLARSDTNKICN